MYILSCFVILGFQLEEEKKFSSRNEKEELKTTNQRLDILSSEHEKALNSLNVEKQATEQLKVCFLYVLVCVFNDDGFSFCSELYTRSWMLDVYTWCCTVVL